VFVPPLERALTWPFVPHVTVADEMAHARIAAAVEALADARFVVPFDRVHLLREERDDEGRRVWRPVADVAFGRPAVVGRGGLELTITEGGALDRETAAWLAREWDRVHEATRPDEAGWDQRPFSLTARRDGRLVGAATGWTNLGAAYLAELVVEAGARGEGVGSHLLAAVEDLARRRGCHTMGLMTEADGAARRLYERRGWTIEWVQEDWIAGRDWARMRRDL